MREPFFIVGCVRSGTTLLRDILRKHKNLECPEETNFFRWGDPFASVRYNDICKMAVLKKHREMDGISEEDFDHLYDQASTRRDLADSYARQYLQKHSNPHARWFDKTPQNVYGMLLISAMYPDVKFVHIHRNPLNVVSSLTEGRVMRPHTVKGGVNYWVEAMLIINKFRQAWPGQMFELSYESLTTEPVKPIERLLRFIGEDPALLRLEPSMVHPEKNKYKKLLTAKDIRYIKTHCQPFIAQYGYS